MMLLTALYIYTNMSDNSQNYHKSHHKKGLESEQIETLSRGLPQTSRDIHKLCI